MKIFEAVDTGICALITRVQYTITEKMSVFLDEMEYDAGLRSVIGVQECLITRQTNLQTEHQVTKVNTIITIRRVWFPITLQYKESF
jgi:hypothetical protein